LDSSLRDFSVWGYVNVSVNKTLYNDVESSVECGSGWVDDGHAYRCGEDVRICERVEGNRCFWMQGTPAGYETEYRMVLREIVNKTLAVDPHKGVEAEIRFRPAAESGKFDVYVQSNHILGEIDPYWTTDPSGGNWYAVGKDKERSGSVDYNLGDLASQGTLASAVASGNNYGGDSLVSSLYYASGSIEVEAWDLVSGSSSWTNTIKGSNSVMGGMYDGDGGFWYQTWSNGKFNITKIDATDGSIICSNQSDDSYSYFSPLVTDNDIVIAYSGSGKIYGVKKGDCGHAYTIACTLALYGYCAYDGNSVYCPCSQGTIQFDPSDGTVNASWSGAPATSPGIALDDDYVYVGDGDSILFLDIKDGSTEADLTALPSKGPSGTGGPSGGFTLSGDYVIEMRQNDSTTTGAAALVVASKSGKNIVCDTSSIIGLFSRYVPMTSSADPSHAYCASGYGVTPDRMEVIDLSDCSNLTHFTVGTTDAYKQPIINQTNVYLWVGGNIYHFDATTTEASSSSSSSSSSSVVSSSSSSVGTTTSTLLMSYLKSDGDLTVVPAGRLILNVSRIQIWNSGGQWSCCGPDNSDVWSCSSGECT